MDPAVLISVIGAIQVIVGAIITGMFRRDAKRRKAHDENMENRAKLRAEESRLSMQLMSANAGLSIATGLAVKEGRTNGKMTAALASAEQAQRDYYAFINRVASAQMTAD
jgi:hypothetical protein